MPYRSPLTVVMTTMLALASLPGQAQAADETLSIETLLKGGWVVSGYTGTFDNRSSLILFRHPTETHLVQCNTIYDVTRTPRTFANCYELR